MAKTKSTNPCIGNVIGEARPSMVYVVVSRELIRQKPLEIGEFVAISYPEQVIDSPVLGMVTKLSLQNIEIPESLIRGPESFERLGPLGDLSQGEVLVAQVRIVGYIDNGILILPRFPPVPGAKVRRAPLKILQQVFGHGHIRLGVLRANREVEVRIDVNEMVRRHIALLAITGGGKGNTVAVAITQIIKMGGSVLVIDPHNEYHTLKEKRKKQVVIFSETGDASKGIRPIQFKLDNFGTYDLFDILRIPTNATKQRALLRLALHKVQGSAWGWNELTSAISEVADEENKYREQVIALKERMIEARELKIFDKSREIPLSTISGISLVKPRQLSIISLSGLRLEVQQAIVKRIAQKVYHGGIAWRTEAQTDKIACPTLLVVEEAHNFAPAQTFAASLEILKRIAAEGRKFGVGLCIVSQRPGKVHSDVLSQCNSFVVLRIVNPFDQQQIRQSAEAITEDLIEDLPGLNVGEAVITGSILRAPALVKIDKFVGKLGGDDVDIVGAWSTATESLASGKKSAQDYDSDSDPF